MAGILWWIDVVVSKFIVRRMTEAKAEGGVGGESVRGENEKRRSM